MSKITATEKQFGDYTRLMIALNPGRLPRLSGARFTSGPEINRSVLLATWYPSFDVEIRFVFRGDGKYDYTSGWTEEIAPLYSRNDVPITELPSESDLLAELRMTGTVK